MANDTDKPSRNGMEFKDLELWKSGIMPAQGKTRQAVAALGL